MSTSPCLDVHSTTRAVIEWQSDNTTRVLSKPDPKVSSITLTARFDSTSTLFDVHIPLKLKGLENRSDITLRACASSIISLDLVKNPTVPTEVEQELESTALGLRFELNCNLDILVPTPALEPVRPAGRAHSGLVLDTVREFARATAFTIYIEAHDAPPKLQSISDAVSQGLFRSSRSSRFQLASMYAGLGAKIIQLAADNTLMPPYYEEVESPPPPPPSIDHKPDRKRPRQDTETERVNDIAQIWAELQMLKQAEAEGKVEDRKRITVLETENQKLREAMDEIQDRYVALKKSHEDLSHSFKALETAVGKNTEDFEESVNNELAELREDISMLDNELSFIQDGQVSDESVTKIKDVILLDITTRLSAGWLETILKEAQRRPGSVKLVERGLADTIPAVHYHLSQPSLYVGSRAPSEHLGSEMAEGLRAVCRKASSAANPSEDFGELGISLANESCLHLRRQAG